MSLNKLIVVSDKNGRAHVTTTEKYTKKLKVRVRKDNITYDYNINGDGIAEVIPLQLGNGEYIFTLYKNVNKNKYSVEGQVAIDLNLSNELLPFLAANQYVNYNDDDLPNDINTVKKAKEYVESCFYDYVRATLVKPGTLPDIQYVVSKRRGICQDFAATFVAFCRKIQVPAKLIIGYANGNYHAWCEYWENGNWITYDPTAKICNLKIKKYCVERFY